MKNCLLMEYLEFFYFVKFRKYVQYMIRLAGYVLLNPPHHIKLENHFPTVKFHLVGSINNIFPFGSGLTCNAHVCTRYGHVILIDLYWLVIVKVYRI